MYAAPEILRNMRGEFDRLYSRSAGYYRKAAMRSLDVLSEMLFSREYGSFASNLFKCVSGDSFGGRKKQNVARDIMCLEGMALFESLALMRLELALGKGTRTPDYVWNMARFNNALVVLVNMSEDVN